MLSIRVIANRLTGDAFPSIVAAGMTFVILSGGIGLSAGSVVAFAGVFRAVVLRDTSGDPLQAFALALTIAPAFGAAMGTTIHCLEMPPFLVTLPGIFRMRGVKRCPPQLHAVHPGFDTAPAMVSVPSSPNCSTEAFRSLQNLIPSNRSGG